MSKGIYKRTKPAWNKGHITWHTFICKTCKISFLSKKIKSKFCSRKCTRTDTQFQKGFVPWSKGKHLIPWNKGDREVVRKICPTCKKEFLFVLSGNGSKPRGQKFCSKKCDRNKAQFQKGHITWIKEKGHSEATKEKLREARLHQVFPVKNTSLELKVHGLLTRQGVKYETHYPVLGQPDIFIEPNILVFCDGCYWHKCFICGFGIGREKDREITNKLREQGYKVIRIWEHDVDKIKWKTRFVKNVMALAKGGA